MDCAFFYAVLLPLSLVIWAGCLYAICFTIKHIVDGIKNSW